MNPNFESPHSASQELDAHRQPIIEIYYDPNREPLPEVIGWCHGLGIATVHRTPLEAPAEWLQKYGCCFPWVVADGRIVLKAGFQRSHLERLAQRWFGTPLIAWLRTPKRVPHELSPSGKSEFQSVAVADASAPQRTRHLQVWELEPDPVSTLSALLLQSFRQGWRPILLGLQSAQPPAGTLIDCAINALQRSDMVIARNEAQELVLFGTRAWHGELFRDLSAIDQQSLLQLTKQATDMKLKVTELMGCENDLRESRS